MNQTTTYDPIGSGVAAVRERNRVLRNTYCLLALSMVPTVLGAWIGVTSGIARAMSPGVVGLVVFLVGAFGFMFGKPSFHAPCSPIHPRSIRSTKLSS